MTNWREATEKYRQAQNAATALSQSCEHAAYQLEQFLDSSLGREALELLAASRRHIIFGETKPVGGRTTVSLMTGDGLHKSQEAAGMWIAYTTNVPNPVLSPISVKEAVEAAVKYGRKDPEQLIRWLREELDKVAAAAPEPAKK